MPNDQEVGIEKYCPRCGLSCVPLGEPHSSKKCDDCGRKVHFVRRDGDGIRVEKGETFTIPAGWLQISLEPKPNARLFRSGLPFLLNQLFAGKLPSEETMGAFLKEQDGVMDGAMERIAAARGVEKLTDETAHQLLASFNDEDKMTQDWYFLMQAIACGGAQWSIDNNNPTRAAWAGYLLGTYRGLTTVSEPLFEETLWRGYLANEVVYEAAAAAGNRNPAEIEALKKLQPLFANFDEATLHALVESGLPIGPKINVKNLPEELLKALAKYHLASLQRQRGDEKQAEKDEREDARQLRKERREDIELRVKWAGFGAAVVGTIVGLIAKFA